MFLREACCSPRHLLTCALLFGSMLVPLPVWCADGGSSEGLSPIERRLRERIAADPEDGAGWRMLGLLLQKRGRYAAAEEAFERAVALMPLSAAAHFCLGEALLQRDPRRARTHLQRAVALAPDSEYARDSQVLLNEMPEAAGGLDAAEPARARPEEIAQVGFEYTPFEPRQVFEKDESIVAPQPPALPRRIYSRVEAGVLYDSNVALAPTSRNLPAGDRASAQAFLAPELQYDFLTREDWVAGGIFVGRFNVNEGNFREFNLQSYQPGVFVEHTHAGNAAIWIPRVQYDFTHDEFEGETFGNRHALTSSVNALWDSGGTSALYWTLENTNYAYEGILPEVTSRDGWSNVVGVSHTIYPGQRLIDLYRFGATFQRADTDGTDFSFNGINLFGEVLVPITDTIELELEGGWGYRDYFEYEFEPGRNEHIWRTALELRKWFTADFALAVVYSYDRFDSDSPLFTARRHVTGVVATYVY